MTCEDLRVCAGRGKDSEIIVVGRGEEKADEGRARLLLRKRTIDQKWYSTLPLLADVNIGHPVIGFEGVDVLGRKDTFDIFNFEDCFLEWRACMT